MAASTFGKPLATSENTRLVWPSQSCQTLYIALQVFLYFLLARDKASWWGCVERIHRCYGRVMAWL